MFLDPNRNGIEVWYSNKMRNLQGGIEECTKWIIDVSFEKYDPNDKYLVEEVKEALKHNQCSFVYFKNDKYIQYESIMLDTNGLGKLWADYFDKIGFRYEKVDVKRVKL